MHAHQLLHTWPYLRPDTTVESHDSWHDVMFLCQSHDNIHYILGNNLKPKDEVLEKLMYWGLKFDTEKEINWMSCLYQLTSFSKLNLFPHHNIHTVLDFWPPAVQTNIHEHWRDSLQDSTWPVQLTGGPTIPFPPSIPFRPGIPASPFTPCSMDNQYYCSGTWTINVTAQKWSGTIQATRLLLAEVRPLHGSHTSHVKGWKDERCSSWPGADWDNLGYN